MKVFIRYEEISENKGLINLVHFRPDTISEELKKTGVMVETYEMPKHIEGKEIKEYINLLTKEIWVEYEDATVPSSDNPEIANIQNEIYNLQETVDAMLGGV